MRAYERQTHLGESAKAFEAYKCYRDLGSERSLAKAAEIYYGSRKNLAQIGVWSRKFNWVERAGHRDDYIDMIRLQAVEESELTRAADTARRTEALREQNLANEERAAKIEAKYLGRVEQILDELPAVKTSVVKEDEDGKPVVYLMEPGTKNAVLDAARLHRLATRSEPSKVDLRSYDLSSATEEQLQRIVDGEDPARVLGDGA